MKLVVDAGALCSEETFGTYNFTDNFIQAVSRYSPSVSCVCYVYAKHVLNNERLGVNISFKLLQPPKGWMRWRVPLALLFEEHDAFLGLSQALPQFGGKNLIAFSHGVSFLNHPQDYPDYKKLKRQMDDYMKRSKVIIVSSSRVKDELVAYSSLSEHKIKTIPFGIPFDMQTKKNNFKRKKYLMFVGNNQAIKNVDLLVRVFTQFHKHNPTYSLLLVGPFEHYRSSCINVDALPKRSQLQRYYQEASLYCTFSKYESFNLPALEALANSCPVAGSRNSIIPEMGEWAQVFNTEKQALALMNEHMKAPFVVKQLDKLYNRFSWERYVSTITTFIRQNI